MNGLLCGSVITLIAVAGLAGCGGDDPDGPGASSSEPATWVLREHAALKPSTTSFVALVTRLECSGGVTGKVLAPEITATESRIVVTFSVARRDPEGFSSCPSNKPVPYTVHLGERLGHRALADGACEQGGAAVATADCMHNPRYTP